MIHVRSGKGRKDRMVTMSEPLLQVLRAYWRERRPKGPYLFPGKHPRGLLHPTSFEKALTMAGLKAGIQKRVYPHLVWCRKWIERECRGFRVIESCRVTRTPDESSLPVPPSDVCWLDQQTPASRYRIPPGRESITACAAWQ